MYTVFICILFHVHCYSFSVYLLTKELCSENVLELSYKTVTGFKQHLNEIISSLSLSFSKNLTYFRFLSGEIQPLLNAAH